MLDLAEAFDLQLVLSGAEEAWRVAGAIARARVPVILEPLTNLPTTFQQLGARLDNATLLAAAGVELVMTRFDAHELRNLRQQAGNAVAEGLDRNAALRALTSNPAAIFGQPRRGSLEPGQTANLVQWNGDPFELTTYPLRVVVQGRTVPLETRQTQLFERYRQLGRHREP